METSIEGLPVKTEGLVGEKESVVMGERPVGELTS